MKLLFVMEDFTFGGVERVTLQLIKGLIGDYDCKISVACQSESGPLLSEFQKLCHVSKDAHTITAFRSLNTAFQPDVVVFTKGGLSKLGAFIPSKSKSIVIQHVPIQLPEASRIKNILRRMAASILFRTVNKVVCVSDGILDNLIKLKVCSASDAIRIYNPVLSDDIQQLANEPQDEYHNYYVCVGRLHFQKGYDLLLKSIEQLDDFKSKVVILGDGPDRQQLQALIEQKGLQDTVVLHGLTNNPYKYIKHAKAILLSSRWEGLPTVLVEASYLQTPIVAFDCRYGPKELTQSGQYGLLIPFGETDKFAQAILDVERGLAPNSVDVEEFKLPSAVKNYYTLFKSL
ncbi:glycosyltransferase [Pseudoalteromonas sp. T1lg23B]|uniref:glycosyltransferase n=1 Tax=Pseudoalteromonas sp. T1lg23B TaxID=2077097 RepID=UPI000CF69A1B|nr:glycosyltransferase [Pseudoalteromonas sp. T1lg23B]